MERFFPQGVNGVKGDKGDSGLTGPQGPSVSTLKAFIMTHLNHTQVNILKTNIANCHTVMCCTGNAVKI